MFLKTKDSVFVAYKLVNSMLKYGLYFHYSNILSEGSMYWGEGKIHQGIFSSTKFSGRKSFRQNSLGENFKGWVGVTFATFLTTKYILRKVAKKYILYKAAQVDIIYNLKSSLDGRVIYYKK